ncbi:unnamed protein product [Fusarium graminearum]|nr:hypothetical protein HG531_008421 [Fusarium graminearum]PCD32247.1 hypothetical protein FGRA07_09499 [Fusarium graminearum]CAG1988172.1 unnamed protein product [Fusarium graminearum]CAG1994776.1 unnamed protein product [Fusarium graminearum]CAG2007452.1 unnamed protein product [Fusarium graminearum]
MSRYQGSHNNRNRERVSVRGSRIRYADEIEDGRQYESNWKQGHPHQLDERQLPPHMQRATTFRPEVSKDKLDKDKFTPYVPNKTSNTRPDYSESDSEAGESPFDYRSGGSIRRSSARTSLPSRSSGSSNKLRQKGSHSLSGICNKDTISKDNTVGHGAQMDDLLASFGRKAMGIKDEHQYRQAIPETILNMVRPISYEEFDPEVLLRHDRENDDYQKHIQASRRQKRQVHRYRVSDTIHGPVTDLIHSEDEDEIFEAGKRRYVLPRNPPRREYSDKASAAMRYIQSSKKEHKERKTTPQYALDKQNGVSLDIPDEDSDGYDSDLYDDDDEYEVDFRPDYY